MVRINKPSHIPTSSPVVKPTNRTESTEKSASVRKEKQDELITQPLVERRKSNDDRRATKKSRGPYDMRSGKDRRKNSKNSGVDLKI
jgi:hypothetical protein